MFFALRGYFFVSFGPKGLFGRILGLWECCPVLILHTGWILGLVFSWEMEKIWTLVLHKNCSCICELDVRILNHLNWTTTAQVMLHFIPKTAIALFDPSHCP